MYIIYMEDLQKIRAAVEQRMGIVLPQPHEDRFAEVMQQLEVQAPDLFWQLRGVLMAQPLAPEVQVPEAPRIPATAGDVYQAQRRVVRSRAQLADLVQRFFYYRDQVSEQWVLDNRKFLVAVALGLLGMGWGYTALARWLAPVTAQTTVLGTASQPVPEVELPVPPNPVTPAATPRVASPPLATPQPVASLTSAPWPQPQPLPELPLPTPQAPLLGVYQESSPPTEGVALTAGRAAAGTLMVAMPPSKMPTLQLTQSTTTARLALSGSARSGQVKVLAAEVGLPAIAELPEASPPVQENPVAAMVLPSAGSLLEGELVLGIVLVEGSSGPVVARDSQGGLWLGRATLDRARRVQVVFDRWAQGEQIVPRAARAYSQGLPGLPAQIRDETPALAADLLRGALAGVAQYARVAAQQTRWRREGGGVVETVLPDLGTVVAGAIAELFAVQPGEKALVRLAMVPAATPVQIMVGVGSVGAPE